MYYIVVKTKYNEIKLILEDFYDESFQQLIQQPYVQGIYLRYIHENELETNPEYASIYRVNKKKSRER